MNKIPEITPERAIRGIVEIRYNVGMCSNERNFNECVSRAEERIPCSDPWHHKLVMQVPVIANPRIDCVVPDDCILTPRSGTLKVYQHISNIVQLLHSSIIWFHLYLDRITSTLY